MNLKKLLLNGRVLLLILVIVGSILTIIAQGITYGLDISGGVEITVQLEKPVDEATMEEVRISLENRLNTLGVKDITLEPWGDQIIKIRVANVTEEEASSIIDTINRQGVFYAEFDGVISVSYTHLTLPTKRIV